MADYTMTVYELMQNGFDFQLNEYPIFDEEYRDILNNAILDFYKFREIAYPLPALWRDRLKARMSLIMRTKYNDLYKIKQTDFNALYNVDMTETYEHTVSNTASSTTNNDNTYSDTSKNVSTTNATTSEHRQDLASNFPSEKMLEDDLSEGLYVDTATKITTGSSNDSNSNDENTSSGNASAMGSSEGESNTVETYTRKTLGSSAGLPFSKALLQFKEYVSQYDLDKQIIDELADLFIAFY